MGIFDIFSAKPGEQASRDTIAGIQQGKDEAAGMFGQGRGAINTGYDTALTRYLPYQKTANAGMDQYARLLGFGPGGSGDMQSTLAGMPGYQFALNQGLDAAKAAAAKGGFTNSGNLLMDLNKQGQGVANQQYFNYANQLAPFMGYAGNAASGMAGIDTGRANALNASYTNEGQMDYGADTSIGQARAGGDLAGQKASGNLWGAGLALAGDVAQMYGGKGGGGGGGKSLFGGFGSGA